MNFQVGETEHKMDVYKTFCHPGRTPNVEAIGMLVGKI